MAESRGTELELTAAAADWPAYPQPLWRTHPKHWPDIWRRSIQARIVTGTLLMSTLVLILVGWVMMSQVTDGVLESRRTSAQAEALAQLTQLSNTINAADRNTINQQLSELVLGSNRPGLYDVLLVPTDSSKSNAIRYTGLVDSDSIPQSLASSVMSDESKLYDTYTQINYRDGPSVPGLVIGSQLRITSTNERYAVYFLFPLTAQQETLDVVQRALLTAGLLLIVLLGAVAWLVTRQVVTPVRMARRIAERLAAGKLEERMQVRGTDDLARLAVSFNKMASNLQRQIRRLEELSRLQRRFVSDVSHELRTPLTTVRMAADLLHESRDQFDPISRRSVELLQNELNRFEELLADLLEISRFDAGAAALDLEDVDLRDIVNRVLENHETLLQRKGCEVQLDMAEAVPRPGGLAPDRAHPAQPDRQRHRAQRGPADPDQYGARRGRGGGCGPGPRYRFPARGGGDGVQPVLARRPGPGQDHRRHRPRPVHRPGGRPAARRPAGRLGLAG